MGKSLSSLFFDRIPELLHYLYHPGLRFSDDIRNWFDLPQTLILRFLWVFQGFLEDVTYHPFLLYYLQVVEVRQKELWFIYHHRDRKIWLKKVLKRLVSELFQAVTISTVYLLTRLRVDGPHIQSQGIPQGLQCLVLLFNFCLEGEEVGPIFIVFFVGIGHICNDSG